jgi:hypothetical protein
MYRERQEDPQEQLCPHTDRIDPSANEFTRGRTHSWLTIIESIAKNLFTLGDR